MPWWLALLNSALGIMSAGFGVVAVIRPQTLDPSWDGESGERFYPAMYADRSVPLGVLVAAVVGTVGPAIGPTSASAEKPVEDTIAAVRSAAALFLKLFFINMPFLRWRRSPPSFDF